MISSINFIFLRARLTRNANGKCEEGTRGWKAKVWSFSDKKSKYVAINISWRKRFFLCSIVRKIIHSCNKILIFFITVVLFSCKLLTFCQKSCTWWREVKVIFGFSSLKNIRFAKNIPAEKTGFCRPVSLNFTLSEIIELLTESWLFSALTLWTRREQSVHLLCRHVLTASSRYEGL